MGFFAELKRRNVIRVAVAYAVAAWLLVQVMEIAVDAFEAPAWVLKIVMTLLAIGLIPALAFSWVYELTPEGLKKESEVPPEESVTVHTAKKLDIAVIGLLAFAIALFAIDRFWLADREHPGGIAPAVEVADGGQVNAGSSANEPDGPPIVAVLPFTARTTGDDDGRFLADGLHDDLLTQLAKLDVFRVVSRTSVLEYLDTPKNMRQIGEELGANAILEGGLQQAGNRVRINMQLIDATNDQHLWADTFERELTPENIFAIQAEIARAIASALRATLTEEAAAEIANAPTSNQAAYEAFLQGRLNSYSLDDEIQSTAIRNLQNAVTLDPEYAEAWAWLGMARLLKAWFTDQIRPDDKPLIDGALAAIAKARELEPDIPAASYAEAHYHYWVHADYARALSMINPMIEASPNNADFVAARAWFNRRAGNWEQAVADLSRARSLDPRNPLINFELGAFFTQTRQWNKAEAALETALQVTGDRDTYLGYMATLRLECCGDTSVWRELAQARLDAGRGPDAMAAWLEQAGRLDEAIELMSQPYPDETPTGPNFRRRALIRALNRAGRVEEAHAEAEAFREDLIAYRDQHPEVDTTYELMAATHLVHGDLDAAKENYARADELRKPDALVRAAVISNRASTFADFGFADEALDHLEISLAIPAGNSWAAVKSDPAFDQLRDHPRYLALAEKYGSD